MIRDDQIDRERRERESRDAREHDGAPLLVPEPAERPEPRAQWDGVHGRWIVWDEDQEEWVPVAGGLDADPTVEGPGPGADPMH